MENLELKEPFINYKEEDDDDYDDEELQKRIMEKIREGFIGKVYGVLAYQIILTSIVIYFGLVNSTFQELLLSSNIIYSLCCITSIVCLLLPLFNPKIYQKVPTNYIILTIFTLSYSWIIGSLVCQYTFSSVMSSLFLTFVAVITLSIYAFKTKEDYTIFGGTLLICLVLFLFSSLLLILVGIPFFNLISTYLALILFSVYLIYDTQLLCGKGKKRFSEDDYILAAINLYLDVVILFTKILSILGEKKN